MAVRLSTGYAAAALGPLSFDTVFRDGAISIYTGPQPGSADLAASGTLIARITRDGLPWEQGSPAGGLRFIRDGRYAFKPVDHTWLLTGLGAGTAGWCRLHGNDDDPALASFDAPRIDGSVVLLDTEGDHQLFLVNTDITLDTTIAINHWWYAIPPIGE